MKKKAEMTAKNKIEEKPVFHGCPGTRMKIMDHKAEEVATEQTATVSSQLSQWPVQIKLVPVNAPYFKDANLLIAADCTAYAYGNFHQEFIKNKVTLIGCPKLDEGDYSEKLTQIIANNDIKSVTIVRMEVPLLWRAGKCGEESDSGFWQNSFHGRFTQFPLMERS